MTDKSLLEVGTRVKVRGKGIAEVIDLTPQHNHYVRVLFADGVESAWDIANMSIAPPPKLTREEKYQASVSVIRQSPTAYRVAGWLAVHDSNFHVSAPPKSFEDTKNLLDAHGVDFEVGVTLTESTDATMGRSFSVVTDNPGIGSQFFEETQVATTVYHNNPDKVSMQAREFVLDFLLDELKFKLGKSQDLAVILARVPERFLMEFRAGMVISVDTVVAS